MAKIPRLYLTGKVDNQCEKPETDNTGAEVKNAFDGQPFSELDMWRTASSSLSISQWNPD